MVSFIIEESEREDKDISERISDAVNYINEALPILQAKRYSERLEHMTLVDQLTGLFNRRYLDTSLDILVAGVRRRNTVLGLLMCDMDYFKQVNDEYGHDAGDEVLRQLPRY